MATTLGKAFVLINLVLSLMMAAFAAAIYSGHIDWAGKGTSVTGEKSQGVVPQAKAAADDDAKAANTGLARWAGAVADLGQLEAQRPKDPAVFAEQLDILEGVNKAGQPVGGAVQTFTVAIGQDGKALLDPLGLPQLQPQPPAKPLLSRRAALDELKKKDEDIKKAMATVADLIKQEADRTVEINGVPGKQKGLRDLLAEETQVQQNALAELNSLRGMRYNRQVEADLLHNRRLSLQARLEELKTSLGMALRRP
jgi:hypothetical protein